MITVLTIAGSDSSSGAGIQADFRTFSGLRVHAVSAVTAVTAQATNRFIAASIVPPRVLTAQLHAAMDDFQILAVKIGMLGSVANIEAVARFLQRCRPTNVVLDPVLASTSGQPLLPRGAITVLREALIPLVDVLTPNIPEAEMLLGHRTSGLSMARQLLELGPRSVLLKGGHGRGASVIDYFVEARLAREFTHARMKIDARGTGCVLSSAIAAYLARGRSRLAAVGAAEKFLQRELRRARLVGNGRKHLLLIDRNYE